jgi:hypothetical protein
MEKKTYWKVFVNTYDYGPIEAAVIGSKIAYAKPCNQIKRQYGMIAETYWFNSKSDADAFVQEKRKDRKNELRVPTKPE